MLRYYKLFDLLLRKGMKKSDLRQILSPKTVAKLSKGQYISGEAIDKICLFLDCQPGEIMEVVKLINKDDENQLVMAKHHIRNKITESGIITDGESVSYYQEPLENGEIIPSWYEKELKDENVESGIDWRFDHED